MNTFLPNGDKIGVNRAIIEDYIIRHSPMFERINKEFRQPEVYGRVLNFLKILLPNESIKPFIRPEEEGIFLFYFHRELRLLFTDLAKRIIRLAHGDDQGWIEFSDRFISGVIQGVLPIIEKDPKPYQILEVGMRKLLRKQITASLTELKIKEEILFQKTSRVIDGIFHKIRTSLAKKIILQTNLLQETFLKIPLIIGDNDFELLRNLRFIFFDYKIPFPIFYAIFSKHAQKRSDILLKLADDYLKKADYSSKNDLLKRFPYYISEITNDDLNSFVQTIHEVAEKRLADLEIKRKQILTKLNSAKEDLDTFFQHSLEEFRHELAVQQPYDKIKGIAEKIDLKIGNFYHHFNELNSDLSTLEKRIQEDSTLKTIDRDLLKKWILTPKIRFPLILNMALSRDEPQYDEILLGDLKKAFELVQKEGREEDLALSRELRRGGFFKERLEVNLIQDRYSQVRKEVVIPLAAGFLLEEIVDILPQSDRAVSLDEIVFVSDLIEERKETIVPERLLDQYQKVISLLIYDIRGSTFMGTKLENAEVENEVRNLFNQAMLDVTRKFGGYPIKDTGDGGIILFARNIHDQIENRGHISEAGDSAINAIRCAIAMVNGSEEFVRKNLKHYQDWFKESNIRELEFEGGSFAQLPPEYQRIFQIGIGVVSGWSPKEIFFDRNAFGNFDVSGMLVREANLFSEARSPDRSMVICDEATLFSVILNSGAVSFISPEESKLNITMLDIEQAVEHWISMKKRRIGFIHETRNIAFRKLDVRLADGDQLRLDDIGVSFDDFGLLVDDRGGRVKFAYEVVKL